MPAFQDHLQRKELAATKFYHFHCTNYDPSGTHFTSWKSAFTLTGQTRAQRLRSAKEAEKTKNLAEIYQNQSGWADGSLSKKILDGPGGNLIEEFEAKKVYLIEDDFFRQEMHKRQIEKEKMAFEKMYGSSGRRTTKLKLVDLKSAVFD